MRKLAVLSIVLATVSVAAAKDAKDARDDSAAEKLGWRLGVQAYSFNRYTFFEAVDKAKQLQVKYIEAYPGQRLSKDLPKVRTSHDMSAEHMAVMKKKLDDAGIKVVCYGVVGLSKNEAQSRKVFAWCKKMGIETINSEPAFDAFDTIEKLCKEYNIQVGIHNHPKASRYWNPDTVLKVCKGRSKLIGACADTGHWMRSGVNPVEALKKLEGRIVSFHFKDLNKFGGGHDVPWGTGKGDVKAMLAEVKRQGVRAVFSVEYEHNWTNSVPEIAQCVAYFDKVAAELLQADKKAATE